MPIRRRNQVITGEPKKPMLVRLYDRLAPGEYTRKQDLLHMSFFLVIIIVVVLAIFSIFWTSAEVNKNSVSAELTIPSCSFVTGNESTVESTLTENGFKNIIIDGDGNIKAYGTAEMVDSYKKSYKDRSVKKIDDMIANGDYSGNGITSISLSDDARTLTITTLTNVSIDSSTLSQSVDNDSMNTIINTYATWCGIRNNGEKMKTVFKYAMTLDDTSKRGDKYYESTQTSGSKMVAELEAKEQSESNNNQSDSSDNQKEE